MTFRHGQMTTAIGREVGHNGGYSRVSQEQE
jgi:hypothetical protein